MILGTMKCDKCGIRNIEHAEQLRIWYAEDAELQICEAVCDKCKSVAEDVLTDQELEFFLDCGVEKLDFGDKFEPLTEELIDGWDIAKELYDCFV